SFHVPSYSLLGQGWRVCCLKGDSNGSPRIVVEGESYITFDQAKSITVMSQDKSAPIRK
ncbi:hypothetical protein BgiBS90_019263, partial [Biomphalaria glabrata]